ncbi:MAG: DUF1704 domain-containing protein [Thermoanaerobaculia bacterium]|nr:DUF1704 domain-containing protein [Thermoanaerobaculia bacterium]
MHAEVAGLDFQNAEPIVQLRQRYLARQLEALIARAAMLEGERKSFDEESRALYDAVAPTLPAEHFEKILAELDAKLTEVGVGAGSVSERLEAFRQRFVIPPEKVDVVFRAAVDACRERTAAHLELPEGESFVIEYVNDKPWSGYNWYKGKYHSLIQVNLDLPVLSIARSTSPVTRVIPVITFTTRCSKKTSSSSGAGSSFRSIRSTARRA